MTSVTDKNSQIKLEIFLHELQDHLESEGVQDFSEAGANGSTDPQTNVEATVVMNAWMQKGTKAILEPPSFLILPPRDLETLQNLYSEQDGRDSFLRKISQPSSLFYEEVLSQQSRRRQTTATSQQQQFHRREQPQIPSLQLSAASSPPH